MNKQKAKNEERTEIDLPEGSAANFPTETELVPNSSFHSAETLKGLGNWNLELEKRTRSVVSYELK